MDGAACLVSKSQTALLKESAVLVQAKSFLGVYPSHRIKALLFTARLERFLGSGVWVLNNVKRYRAKWVGWWVVAFFPPLLFT